MTRSNDLDTLLNNGVQINQSSPWRRRKSEWTFDENKRFENALASFNHDSPDLFEDIGSRIEEKTIQEVKEHYESLVRDVKMIESGNCDNTFAIPSPIPLDQNTSTSKQVAMRKKVNKWSQEEHRKFLIGLEKIGGGDWRGISRFCVQSRTPTQVASHAQKYFLKLKQQHANRRSQNANVVSECNKAEDAAMNTRVLPSGISDPRVVCIADQPFPAPQFS